MANSFTGEIIHFHTVRIRTTGSGNLDLSLKSVDEVNTATLPSIPLLTATNREATVLCNFKDQMGYLEFSVDAINEYFLISKITIFIRPIATGYAQ